MRRLTFDVALAWAALALCLLAGCAQRQSETGDGAGEHESPDGDRDAATEMDSSVEVGEDADAGEDDGAGGDADAGENLQADAGLDVEVWIPEAGDFVFRDAETGSLWNVLGQAFEGPLRGARLRQRPAFTVFWLYWSSAHGGAPIWNQDSPNAATPIDNPADPACDVPCDEIVGGGPGDTIPALDHLGRWDRPQAQPMVAAGDPGADYLTPTSMVLGLSIDGEARAYPHALLDWHEIHVDEIAGTEVNVTYCPLVGSGIAFPARSTPGADPTYFYVSGRLFNDNLTMFQRGVDEADATLWNQMLTRGITGQGAGRQLSYLPIVETTWARWQQMHPDTLVASDDTGYDRAYGSDPYAAYHEPDSGTLNPVSSAPDPRYPNKSRVLAIEGESTSKAYPFMEMDTLGDRVLVHDELDGAALLVVYEAASRMAIPFERVSGGEVLTFEGVEWQ